MLWEESLGRNKFIISLYDKVPELLNIRIAEIKINDEGRRVAIKFDMPCFPDYPPKKWMELGYNTAIVEVDLFDIKKISLESNSDTYRADIKVENKLDNFITIIIDGSVKGKIKAMGGYIQDVKGYIREK